MFTLWVLTKANKGLHPKLNRFRRGKRIKSFDDVGLV